MNTLRYPVSPRKRLKMPKITNRKLAIDVRMTETKNHGHRSHLHVSGARSMDSTFSNPSAAGPLVVDVDATGAAPCRSGTFSPWLSPTPNWHTELDEDARLTFALAPCNDCCSTSFTLPWDVLGFGCSLLFPIFGGGVDAASDCTPVVGRDDESTWTVGGAAVGRCRSASLKNQ